MLETMRRNSRHAIIYVLFGILIAAFVISFGPGSRGFGYTGVSSAYAAKVAGSTVSEQDFHFAYVALGGTQYPPQVARERRLKEFVMDRLIERELFATEAEKLGYNVSNKEAEDMIDAGKMMVMGVPRRVDAYVYKDGKFDYDRFKMVVAEPARRDRAALHRDPEARDARRQDARGAARLGEGLARRGQAGVRVARPAGQPRVRPLPRAPLRGRDRRADAGRDRRLRQGARGRAEEAVRRARLPLQEPRQAGPAAPHRRRRAKDAQAGRGGAHQGQQRAQPRSRRARPSPPSPRTSPPTIAPRQGRRDGLAQEGLHRLRRRRREEGVRRQAGHVIGPERTERGFELVEVEHFREGDVPLAEAEKEMADDEVQGAGQGQGERRRAGGRSIA